MRQENIKYIKSLHEYCEAINISPPKHKHFDIRSFEENMPTVVTAMPPFRHKFYALAIKKDGSGFARTGTERTAERGYIMFFNSPYQVTSWEILPDWQGYYIIFTQEFVSKSAVFNNLLLDFPYLRLDQAIPFDVQERDVQTIVQVFESIYKEYHSPNEDRLKIIQAHTFVLLNYVKRYYDRSELTSHAQKNRNQDLQLISRYQALIEINLAKEESINPQFAPHSTTFYAERLNIHPNYLNTLVKRITGDTALKLLHKTLFNYSSSLLLQTQLSIKEIAYSLHFKEAAHFSNFFKKYARQTPQQFRDNQPT